MLKTGDLRIDSHKLIFHPRRVSRWMDGEIIYPLYMEISPSGACNHRCTFCAKDYLGYHPQFIPATVLHNFLTEAALRGVSSIMYGGEGEPLLHPDIADIVARTREAGIDAAMSTNGVLLTPDLAAKILPLMTWLKVSINAGTPAGYADIHRCGSGDFHRVIDNLAAASAMIAKNGWGCTLGAQAVLLPDNAADMETLAETVRDAGVSYLVIKPYSQHHKSATQRYAGVDYSGYAGLAEKLERFNNDRFTVIFRGHTMQKMHRTERGYERCLALPFWAYVDAAGRVWGCNSFIGDERFYYGNINESSFRDIWEGERRRQSLAFVAAGLDTETCRMNCRMDEINLYLWELTHPSAHVNFI